MFPAISHDCPRCPRLLAFHQSNRMQFKDWHNGPVPSFGGLDAQLLVVGLAPGLRGANRTGRPFTGDYAGLILYAALKKHGFATGNYQERPDDGFELVNCRITNAVRCVPPENKPETEEIKACNDFLKQEIAAMQNLKVILSLGNISHSAVLSALGQKKSAYKFVHGAVHEIGFRIQDSGKRSQQTERASCRRQATERLACFQQDSPRSGVPFDVQQAYQGKNRTLSLINTYHTSRYNMNTRRLTEEMFDAVVAKARGLI